MIGPQASIPPQAPPGIDRGKAAFVGACFVLLALYPLVGGKFGVDLVTKTMIFAVLALSLELLVGGVGLVCFGQAAFFGIGAYAAVLLSPASDGASVLWLLPASIAAAAAAALLVGALSLRTRGGLLHHGDAGLRADGLLHRARHAAGRRHRRHLP
jgi:ABC-type branched-subunit amino acid transport system permease subunit